MEHNGEEHMSATVLSIANNNNKSGRSEYYENMTPADKTNTIIVRCSESINQTVNNIRPCTACLKKIDPDYYFLWELMEFCNVLCISKFQGLNFKCTFCSRFINNTLFGKFYVRFQKSFRFFCSVRCMDHFKLTLKICSCCQEIIIGNCSASLNSVGKDGNNISFCSAVCLDTFNTIIKPPKAPQSVTCCVCKQNKCIAIILKHDGMSKYFCAKRCLIAYSFVKLQTGTEQCIMCQNYFSQKVLNKFMVYYENVPLNFCSNTCQNIYVLLNGTLVSCNWCQNKRYNFGMIRKFSLCLPPQSIYICSVYCFKLFECATSAGISPTSTSNIPGIITSQYTGNILASSGEINKQIVVHAQKYADQRNVATMCFIPKANKDVMVQPETSHKQTQTDDIALKEIILPIPVPLYVPTPMAMYSIPVPTAVPFLLPVPVPVFIPISKQSYTHIENEIKTTFKPIPKNMYEAELLQIADIIAYDKENESDIHVGNERVNDDTQECTLLKEDSDFKRKLEINDVKSDDITKKCKTSKQLDNLGSKTQNNKKGNTKIVNQISLDYTLGVEALQRWIGTRDRLSQRLIRSKKIPKLNILQTPPEKLNLILDSFINGLKKPDGSNYAPDTIYYLCLGIQYYLFENGRVDNIFLDKNYNKFADTFNKFAEKFSICNLQESHFIVTRVSEEHLWETKQLGNYSPQSVLNSLVFFNMKYYHCSTIKQHLDISFSQILKLWSKKAKSKSIILRFHPRKPKDSKRVYEQYCNDADPSRCPIKLYEFYLSKCPESVKTSNCVFYLQPEQYCTSESPLWYMSSSLSEDILAKMVNTLKMVKEINVALLTN